MEPEIDETRTTHIEKVHKVLKSDIDMRMLVYIMISLAIIAGGYFSFQGVVKYRNHVRQNEARALEIQKEDAEKEALRDKEIADLKNQLAVLANKPPEIKTVTVEAKDMVSNIVKEWTPRIGHLECTWADVNGFVYSRAAGSATLMNHASELKAVTNKHVITINDQYGPATCDMVLPGGAKYTLVNDFKTNYFVGVNEDWGFIKLIADKTLNAIAKKDIKICTSADVGDKLLVLGYPSIGSSSGLTVTEGIVSGTDGNYYITSAKIDKGNSGGAAILVKDDCYLGIPSASVVGSIESLGRILKASFVIQ